MAQNPNLLDALPMEMVVEILSHAAPPDTYEFSCTCRRFRDVRGIAERARVARCAVRLLKAPVLEFIVKGHTSYVEKVVVGKKYVLTASYDRSIGVLVPMVNHGLKLARIAVNEQLWNLALSPDEQRAWSSDLNGTIDEWTLGNGVGNGVGSDGVARAAQFKKHTNGISGVYVSPNGRWLVSSSADETVRVWDISTPPSTRQCVHVLEGPTRLLECACTNQYVAAGSFSGTVRLWNIATGEKVADWVVSYSVVDPVAFSPGGRYLAAGSNDGRIAFFDLAKMQKVDTVIRVYDNNNDNSNNHLDGVSIIELPPSSLSRIAESSELPQNQARVSEAPLWTFTQKETAIFGLSFSPCGKYIAAACRDGTARVYSFAAGQLKMVLGDTKSWVRSVAWSPCGRYVYTGSNDNSVLKYRVAE